MQPRFENTNNHEGNLKHLVYNLERVVSNMKANGDGVEKLALIIDYEGFSIFNAPPMNTSMETLSILQNHYPERLHKAYFIRPPWIFSTFWAMISPFVDPVTKAKMCFLPDDPVECSNILKADFDLGIIEAEIGGGDDRPFDSAKYLSGEFSSDFLSMLNETNGR